MRAVEIRSLTAIRGVAALWVVTHHLTLFFRYPDLSATSRLFFLGFTGVDIFFILSGFILTTVYVTLELSGLKAFALRRILRIYPLHLAVLLVMAVLAWNSIVWSHHWADWRTLPAVALLLTPYLDLGHGLWNGVTWSAGVELSCYLLFPPVLFLCRRLPLAALFLLVLAACCTEWVVQMAFAAHWTGWPAIARGWGGFGLGMALGLVSTRFSLKRPLAIAGELLSVAVLGWAWVHYDIAWVPLAAAALIWMLSHEAGPVSRLLSLRVPVFLGKISFSIYMLQLPISDVCKRIWPVHGHPPLSLMFITREALYFAVLIAVASLTNRFIERPAQRFLRGARATPRIAMPDKLVQLS